VTLQYYHLSLIIENTILPKVLTRYLGSNLQRKHFQIYKLQLGIKVYLLQDIFEDISDKLRKGHNTLLDKLFVSTPCKGNTKEKEALLFLSASFFNWSLQKNQLFLSKDQNSL
jgi:hypothetical protein